MKQFSQILKLSFLTLLLFVVVGCVKDADDITTPPPAPKPDAITFVDGKTETDMVCKSVAEPMVVRFEANNAWSVSVAPEAKWLAVSADKGVAGKGEITLSVADNMNAESRNAMVTITCGKAKATIAVSQSEGVEVVGFESAEKMVGVDGNLVKLGEITLVSGKSSQKYPGVYWSKEFTEENNLRDDYGQLFFASTLFSTADLNVWFSSYYCDCTIYGAQYDAWGGFVLSSNVNTTVEPSKAGIAEQFSVYATATEGNTFAAAYDAKTAGMAMSPECCWPQIDFAISAREVRSIELANSTWTYHFFTGAATDSYVVKIVGMLDQVEVGSVECELIKGAEKVATWKSFDISKLGKVDQLVFAVVSSEPYAPLYFCMDNLILIK